MNDAATLTSDEIAVARALEGVIGWLRQSRQPQELSASALSVLSRLESAGALRITAIAEREGLSQPGTTTLVNRLVAAGLADRGADPADGRVVLVSISDAGLLRLTHYRESRSELVAARLRTLSAADRQALTAALPALTHIVQTEEDAS
ncbi:MarR family winged helix-turn-helix transcriptional regulator [Frondihabitans australicus]|uniref:DNA-binding MarR family transcriptional regulator n=1 Tax=Frondihabitans australicus TaxID=386892 RepID=A0A495II51_9MICO|nr:MarR family transcriptional regulator [Frondihabitans australicus]RKR75654.1 DNA-binding MarR family transcriptional regulator [Frondihabitans australicus]